MKDLSLSLLSRGCGRLVSSNGNTGRHDGRLDVCFTPQDYFIWKSRDSLLRLSNSGRQIVNEESALPKTYSTRRGQLQLYSQDLVTIETSAVTRDGKQKVVPRYTRQDKSQLSTLKELTAAILSYSNTQYTSSRLGPLFLPPLHHRPLAPDLHHPIPPPLCTTQVQPSPELLGQFNPEWLPAEGIADFLGNQPEGKRGMDGHIGIKKTVRLDLFLQIPCRDKTSQVQPQAWVNVSAMTPEELEDPQTAHSCSQHSTGGERHHSNMNWVHDMADDPGSIQDSLKTHDEGNYERSIRGSRHGRIDPPPPVAGSIAGRKGPGKQSSLAFLQNRQLDLQNPCTSRDPSRGVVRGILPLELRDLQNGKPVGCLILGPDGEIIQLSLYNDNHDHDTQEQALQVLSAEGEKLPLVIVLQAEKTHTGGELEPNTDVPDGDIQHHQAIHKLVEFHTLTEINACSPSSQKDPGKTAVSAVTETKTKTSEAVAWTKVIKNHITLPPLKEQEGKEEPRAGNTEQGSILGSHQPGLHGEASKQNINPNEATTELTGDKRRTNTKMKDAGEAAATTRKRGMKRGKSEASDGQKTSRARTEGGWERQKTKSDAESIRRRTEEERTNREEADTQHHSALPPVRMPDKGGGRGEEKTNEKKKERGEVARQKDESAVRRKRRGRLKDKELAEINEEPMKKEEEINQNIKKASHLKSTERPSATQRHNNKTHFEEEKEHVNINADKHSQSESPLGSAASPLSPKSLKRSSASFCEGVEHASATGLAPSRGCLSSCSTVMIEEELMLNPIKQESSRPRNGLEEEEVAAVRLAKRAERRRQDVERKRREREEEELKQQKREETEERVKSELEKDRRKRAEELRLRKLAEEEERRKYEEEEQERVKGEQAQREREKRRQEERRRQMERLQRMREEEEQRSKDELECLRLEEERQQEEERKKLLEMEESERIEYLCRKEQEEESRRNEDEQRKRREEEATLQAAVEARLQAEQLAREMALLQQQLAVQRRLLLEAGGLEKTQGISRPWIYSYFVTVTGCKSNYS
ncbi:uncharacterized protein KIAA2012 homolog [Pseudochaenichthys georgianus]|uniref:uncharacterized protein KIAA2012 homolog n=1 Tax=Pseudochaenichthys georgianus TaxID=52239 RepID=UPI00146ECE67|nr:uncharacterized protein KIAA2012-like [Pseudochaenichthys georgianus]